MIRRERRRVRPDGRGGYELRLPEPERALLTSLPDQLETLIGAVSGPAGEASTPASLARLLPPAYPRDEDAEATYASAQHPQLLAGRRAGLAVLRQVAQRGTSSASELEACCGALNDLRLVLGTSLEVTEDEHQLDESDPDYPQWVCYGYLSALQTEIVDVLSGSLPPPRPGADDEAPDDPWGEPLGGLRWDGTPLPKP